jgi:hypothetical protein
LKMMKTTKALSLVSIFALVLAACSGSAMIDRSNGNNAGAGSIEESGDSKTTSGNKLADSDDDDDGDDKCTIYSNSELPECVYEGTGGKPNKTPHSEAGAPSKETDDASTGGKTSHEEEKATGGKSNGTGGSSYTDDPGPDGPTYDPATGGGRTDDPASGGSNTGGTKSTGGTPTGGEGGNDNVPPPSSGGYQSTGGSNTGGDQTDDPGTGGGNADDPPPETGGTGETDDPPPSTGGTQDPPDDGEAGVTNDPPPATGGNSNTDDPPPDAGAGGATDDPPPPKCGENNFKLYVTDDVGVTGVHCYSPGLDFEFTSECSGCCYFPQPIEVCFDDAGYPMPTAEVYCQILTNDPDHPILPEADAEGNCAKVAEHTYYYDVQGDHYSLPNEYWTMRYEPTLQECEYVLLPFTL